MDLAVEFPDAAQRAELVPVTFEHGGVCLLRQHLRFAEGYAHEDGRVTVFPGFPGAFVGVDDGFFGFESGDELHDDFLVECFDAAAFVGAFGFVVDDAGSARDFCDQVEGARVADGVVPDGDFGGEGAGFEGFPPFVEAVGVGLFAVDDELFAAFVEVVFAAHGAQGDGFSVVVDAVASGGGCVAVPFGGAGCVADDGEFEAVGSGGAVGALVFEGGFGGHVPVPAAEVVGVLPDDGGDGGDEEFSSAFAGVHASVVGGCGEFGCCHGVPHSRVVVSAAVDCCRWV